MRSFSDQELSDFQTIYYKKFRVRLSKAEAQEQGLALVRLMRVLAQSEGDNEEGKTESNT